MRIVSLVPSVTETLLALGVRPVGCTRFCEARGIAKVGGTKNPDLTAIERLNPHVVVVNDEENRIEDVEALEAMGFRSYSMSPRSVEDVGPAVVDLAHLVEVEPPEGWNREAWTAWLDHHRSEPRVRAFVPIWARPWMTMNAQTYGSSLLAHLGVENLWASDPTRYPEVELHEVRDRAPEIILLPSEPYPFKERHREKVAETFPDATVTLVDGRDLFWWGIRTPDALARLAAVVEGIGVA